MYDLEEKMKRRYPNNQHVRETLRDLLQDYREAGWLKFKDYSGTYLRLE